MEVLCKSDYQDVYRVKDGVLLVVNKFKYIYNKNGYRKLSYEIKRANSKTYAKGCKDLKIATEKVFESNDTVYEIGQVFHYHYPVELVPKEEWEIQIKTTGDLFSGTSEEVLKYIEEIINIIKEEGE